MKCAYVDFLQILSVFQVDSTTSHGFLSGLNDVEITFIRPFSAQ